MKRWRLTVRQIREVLRLRFECGLSHQNISDSCGIAKSSVQQCLSRAVASDITWAKAVAMNDGELEAILYPAPVNSVDTPKASFDWDEARLELAKKGVTKQLLWEEYCQSTPQPLSYSQYCRRYELWLKAQRLSMRQHYTAGEKLFVDFAGATFSVTDSITGEVKPAQVFVATWGASSYTYAEAVWSQDLANWISCHVNALEYFGCMPAVIVPDNLKSGVKDPCYYDPEINPSYAAFASYYEIAIIPAKVRSPKHKAKVEAGVCLVTRWIIAALRKRTFFSLAELNAAIRELLEKLNTKKFQKRSYSRRDLFDTLDYPSAKPLKHPRYEFTEVFNQRVNIDYHIIAGEHFYGVPYKLRGQVVTIRLTRTTVEILYKNERVASYQRSYALWKYTSPKEFLPAQHQGGDQGDWPPSRIISWAKNAVGDHAAELCEAILLAKLHPQQGYRSWLGIYRLSKHYGKDRVNAACQRALLTGKHSYKGVQKILLKGLDSEPLPQADAPPPLNSSPMSHENIRGGEYYKTIFEREDDSANQSNDRQASPTADARDDQGAKSSSE